MQSSPNRSDTWSAIHVVLRFMPQYFLNKLFVNKFSKAYIVKMYSTMAKNWASTKNIVNSKKMCRGSLCLWPYIINTSNLFQVAYTSKLHSIFWHAITTRSLIKQIRIFRDAATMVISSEFNVIITVVTVGAWMAKAWKYLEHGLWKMPASLLAKIREYALNYSAHFSARSVSSWILLGAKFALVMILAR